MTPGTQFQGRHQNSAFSRFLAVVVGYSTLFRVPGTIFGDRDPRDTVSGATSKLVVFAFSGRFRGLAHCLGFRDDFGARDPRYTVSRATSKLVIFAFSRRFRGLWHTFRVPGTIFGARDPRYKISRATSKLVVFAFSGRFRGL